MSASEPEGLAVGTKYAPALHGNLAGFGGGHQWKAKGGNVRENQRGLADHVLWVGGGGAEGQLQVSVHVAEDYEGYSSCASVQDQLQGLVCEGHQGGGPGQHGVQDCEGG